MAWKDDEIAVSSTQCSQSFITAACCHRKSGKAWRTIGVYGPQADVDKISFLGELRATMNAKPGPTICVEDFNLICQAADKSNTWINRRMMNAFRRFISDMELKDLYLHGRSFTWSNEQQHATKVKLDRVLFNEGWHDLFPSCLLQALSSAISDHCPLLLSCDIGFKHNRHFRFENFWVRMEGFQEVVAAAWQQPVASPDAYVILSTKLDRVARALKAWHSRNLSQMNRSLDVINELIFRLDKARDTRDLTPDEHRFRNNLKVRLLGISALQRSFWRQRARVLWIREGDACTKFFHMKASSRRRKNHIQSLTHLGQNFSSQQDKLRLAGNFFSDLLGQPTQRSVSLNFTALGYTTNDDLRQHLEADIEEQEILEAINETNGEKAPGPDGFTGLFYQSCWHIIKTDLMQAIAKFAACNSTNFQALNTAVMILLPKTEGASQLTEFRPISLIHSVAKLIAKILARRLQAVIDDLVAPCQSAFIKRRSILDNFMYVQAMIKTLKARKTPAILLKIDIAKAFNTISWEFLLELLQARGFSRRWINWIAGLLATASTKININGDLSDIIDHRQGLRQGDSLSPLLFVIIMDSLAALMKAASPAQVFQGIGTIRMPFRISMYADDVVLFINPSRTEMHAAVALLELFRSASGLRTNWAKSAATPIACAPTQVDETVAKTECSTKTLPITYLGLPLSDTRLRRDGLQPVIDCLAKRLRGWKAKLIALPGRIELVRTVLSAMAIYRIMAIAPPIWFLKMIDKLRRGFLWAADETAPAGKCLVSWKEVCRPHEFGGLGVLDLQRQGAALRARWHWLRWTDDTRPWTDLTMPHDPAVECIFRASTEIIIGDGRKTSFWHAHWAQGCRPADRWPELFAHCNGRRLTLRAAIEGNAWLGYVKPNPSTAVLHQLCELWDTVAGVTLQEDRVDSLRWKWTADGEFTAASAYRMMFQGAIPTSDKEIIWSAKAAPRAKSFAWILLRGKCLTADNLQRRQIPHDPACALCRGAPETAVHLVAACPFSAQVWLKTAQSLGTPFSNLPMAAGNSLRSRFRNQTRSLPRAYRATWRATCLLVSWCIWKERNERIFHSKASTTDQVHSRILDEARPWLQAGLAPMTRFFEPP